MFFEIEALSSMDSGMCSLIAQVLPVFWLVLALPGGPIGWHRDDADSKFNLAAIMVWLAGIELVTLYGAGHDGLTGYLAQSAWLAVFGAIVGVAAVQVLVVMRRGRGEG